LKAKIVIELTTEIPDSGSGMPDLGHDVYWLMKELPKLQYKDTNGKMKPLSGKYEISRVRTEAQPA
jgi:hypothetical protein